MALLTQFLSDQGIKMAKKNHSGMVLWPEYFDLNLTRSKGRRVSKDLAVPGLNSEELYKACKRAGLSPDLKPEKAFPSRWFDPRGCVVVIRKFPKAKTIEMVAEKLMRKK